MSLRLNLGCADCYMPGWINIDQSESPHIKSDVTADVLKLDEIYPVRGKHKAVDEIYAGHLVEHLTPTEAVDALRGWYSILKPGGKIAICTPDFRAISQMYIEGKITIDELNDVYIFSYCQESHHRTVWDAESLKKLLIKTGFMNVQEMDRINDERLYAGVE